MLNWSTACQGHISTQAVQAWLNAVGTKNWTVTFWFAVKFFNTELWPFIPWRPDPVLLYIWWNVKAWGWIWFKMPISDSESCTACLFQWVTMFSMNYSSQEGDDWMSASVQSETKPLIMIHSPKEIVLGLDCVTRSLRYFTWMLV